MPLPNALYLGLPRCGSTWLAGHLASHPDVFVPAAKDLYFFDRHHDLGQAWYGRQFEGGESARVRIEFSHDYLFSPSTMSRIADLLPDARFVVGLREPTSYLASTVANLRRNGLSEATIALATESGRLLGGAQFDRFVEPWVDTFPADRFLWYRYDELRADPAAVYRRVLGHLDLDEIVPDDIGRPSNAMAAPRSRLAARAAKHGALLARRVGSPTLAGRVKGNPTVRRILYRAADDVPGHETFADGAIRASLRESVHRLAELIDDPDLVDAWGYR